MQGGPGPTGRSVPSSATDKSYYDYKFYICEPGGVFELQARDLDQRQGVWMMMMMCHIAKQGVWDSRDLLTLTLVPATVFFATFTGNGGGGKNTPRHISSSRAHSENFRTATPHAF